MKLNNRGFAVTSIIYSMLVLFLALLLLITSNLANRKVLFDKEKNEILDKLETYSYNEGYEFNFEYTGEEQTFTVPVDGFYKFELWGSKGADDGNATAGRGAYVSGNIELTKGEVLYIYVGGNTTGFNSIRSNINSVDSKVYYGGGATDVRLKRGNNWYDFDSLKSRIMVAAGGGGAEWQGTIGGSGGNNIGINGRGANCWNDSTAGVISYGAGQVYGGYMNAIESSCNSVTEKTWLTFASGRYKLAENGNFGYAYVPETSQKLDYGGLGGGGYFGGASMYVSFGGSGGSSYVSGCSNCIALLENSTEDNILFANHSQHYSEKVFTEIEMYDGTTAYYGNDGIGRATITLVAKL